MEILENFGFNPLMLGAQIVNFLVIFFVLKRFAFKPILQTLKKREETIKEGLRQAEDSRKLLEKVQEDEKNILKKAQLEGSKMVMDAKKQSQMMIKDAKEAAKIQTQHMIEEAKAQIGVETKLAEARLVKTVNTLAMDYLKKSLSGLFGEKEQGEIMQKAVKKLK